MKIERELKQWGQTSVVVVIPPDLLKYMELNVGDTITMQDDEGKHGKFVSFWKKDSMTPEDIKELLIKESGVDNG